MFNHDPLRNLDLFACPSCKERVKIIYRENGGSKTNKILDPVKLACQACGEEFPIDDGIPCFWKEPFEEGALLNATEHEECLQEKIVKANALFHDQTAAQYETDLSTEGISTTYCQQRIKRVLEHIAEHTDHESLLDVGCGTGNVLKHGQNHFDKTIGIDVSLSMLRIAKWRGFFVARASAFQLPILDNRVTAVSAFSLLHHMYDPTPFLFECARILKSEGFLYTDFDPNREANLILESSKSAAFIKRMYSRLRRLDASLRRGKTLTHYSQEIGKIAQLAEYHVYQGNGFDGEELREMIMNAGFRSCRIIKHWNSASFEGHEYSSISLRDRMIKLGEMVSSLHLNSHDLSPLLLVLAKN